jgi:type I restriction enzyme S subunit
MSVFSEMKLGDAVTFQRGFDITKAEQSPGPIPIVSSSGVSSYHNVFKVKAPGVIIGRKGTLGTVHLLSQDYWPHDTTLWVKDYKGNIPQFVAYFLRTLKLQNFDTGSSNPTLNRNHIHKIKVVFPKDPEIQKKIAAILMAYDDLIEVNKRRISLLESMAEELYREWFVRLRFPGHQDARVVEGVPDGWDRVKLDDLIPVDGLEAGNRPKGGAEPFGIPSIGAENVIGIGRYNFSKEKYVNEEFYASMRQGKVRDKDVLFYKDGAEIGRVSLFQDDFPHSKCCVNEHVFLIRTDDLRYQYFIYFYLNQPQIKDYVKLINKNAAQPGINKAELRSIPVVRPPSSLVEDFDELISPLVSEIFTLVKTEITLQQTRDLLLPRLISGKLSVEDLDIQLPPSMQEGSSTAEVEPETSYA